MDTRSCHNCKATWLNTLCLHAGDFPLLCRYIYSSPHQDHSFLDFLAWPLWQVSYCPSCFFPDWQCLWKSGLESTGRLFLPQKGCSGTGKKGGCGISPLDLSTQSQFLAESQIFHPPEISITCHWNHWFYFFSLDLLLLSIEEVWMGLGSIGFKWISLNSNASHFIALYSIEVVWKYENVDWTSLILRILIISMLTTIVAKRSLFRPGGGLS